MEFDQWLASEHRATWIQLMQDRLLSQGIPTDATSVLRYSSQLTLLQEMKTWTLAVPEEKPDEIRKTSLKAGMHKRSL